MANIENRYLRAYENRISFASVEIDFTINNEQCDRIFIETKETKFKSQGELEVGFVKWNESAKKALEVALKITAKPHWLDIKIKKIEGRILLDTNNASVGVASMFALWKHLNVNIAEDRMNEIHQFVKNDWENDINEIPDFSQINVFD